MTLHIHTCAYSSFATEHIHTHTYTHAYTFTNVHASPIEHMPAHIHTHAYTYSNNDTDDDDTNTHNNNNKKRAVFMNVETYDSVFCSDSSINYQHLSALQIVFYRSTVGIVIAVSVSFLLIYG